MADIPQESKSVLGIPTGRGPLPEEHGSDPPGPYWYYPPVLFLLAGWFSWPMAMVMGAIALLGHLGYGLQYVRDHYADLLRLFGLPYLCGDPTDEALLVYWIIATISLIVGSVYYWGFAIVAIGFGFYNGHINFKMTQMWAGLPLLLPLSLAPWLPVELVAWAGALLIRHHQALRAVILRGLVRWHRSPPDTAVVMGQTLQVNYRYDGREYRVWVPYEPSRRLRDLGERVELRRDDAIVDVRPQPGVPLLVTGEQLGGVLYWTPRNGEPQALLPQQAVAMARNPPAASVL